MDKLLFEKLLEQARVKLEQEAKLSGFPTSQSFEDRVREVIDAVGKEEGLDVDFNPHPHVFPDICLGAFGVEVKHTTKDTWRSVANSISEGMRDQNVKDIYVIFCKMGGETGVATRKYEECVMHVRTSHVPRFELDMEADENLFSTIGVSYEAFSQSDIHDKMTYVRQYARSRLKEGERLWWLDDEQSQPHSLPLQVKLYMNLTQEEKRKLRAEAALLCPSIFKPSRTKNKYTDAVMYILTYHGVLCPQARDLFSAGSVALRSDATRGGNYFARALQDLAQEIKLAAKTLDASLIREYWGRDVPPSERLKYWLSLADENARDWCPSVELDFS